MHSTQKQCMAHAGHVADKQDHVSSTKKQLPATSEEQKAVWWNICKYLTQQQCARAAGTCKASWAVQQQRIRILPKEYTDSQRFEEVRPSPVTGKTECPPETVTCRSCSIVIVRS